jgi:hypothetical protein
VPLVTVRVAVCRGRGLRKATLGGSSHTAAGDGAGAGTGAGAGAGTALSGEAEDDAEAATFVDVEYLAVAVADLLHLYHDRLVAHLAYVVSRLPRAGA